MFKKSIIALRDANLIIKKATICILVLTERSQSRDLSPHGPHNPNPTLEHKLEEGRNSHAAINGSNKNPTLAIWVRN